jgi:hypothetical protein
MGILVDGVWKDQWYGSRVELMEVIATGEFTLKPPSSP